MMDTYTAGKHCTCYSYTMDTSGHGITVMCHSHSLWYAESSSSCVTTS